MILSSTIGTLFTAAGGLIYSLLIKNSTSSVKYNVKKVEINEIVKSKVEVK